MEYDKDLDYFREISKRYQSGDFLVVTYTPNGDLFDNKTLDHLAALRHALLQVDGVVSANSILDVPLLYSPKVSLTEVTSGIKTLRDTAVDREQRKIIFNAPSKNMLLGPDGKTRRSSIFLSMKPLFAVSVMP